MLTGLVISPIQVGSPNPSERDGQVILEYETTQLLHSYYINEHSPRTLVSKRISSVFSEEQQSKMSHEKNGKESHWSDNFETLFFLFNLKFV